MVGLERKKVNWVLDADIRGFFDNMSHGWTTKFIEHRVADCRILRLIRKWLKAGVSEDGQWSETEAGYATRSSGLTAARQQYLHYVFDLWADAWRRKVATGDVIIVRYADDLVMGFQHRAEAVRFLEEFKARLEDSAAELHPEKDPVDRVRALCGPQTETVGQRETRRPSRSTRASPTTAGDATRPIPSPSGGLHRNSEWLRS